MCQDILIYGPCGCSSELIVVWNCKVELPKGTDAGLHQLLGLSGKSKQLWHAFLVFFRCPNDLHADEFLYKHKRVIHLYTCCTDLFGLKLRRQLSEATDVSSHQFPKHFWHEDDAPLKEDDGTRG
ncbi:hypothetical protein DVH24_041662 [Malus domestica]|uniref:Uncharacterized protein n=1 Tax=Malus domestica TaxID=3750 RepID=A0A498IRS7_MALDO|nr:hypothetical protein DVH24_041662 [Malus domestica]